MTEHSIPLLSFSHQVLSCLVVDAAPCLVEGPRSAGWTIATLHVNLLVGHVLSEHPFELGEWGKAETYRLGYNGSQGQVHISLFDSLSGARSVHVPEDGTVGGWTCWRA